MGVSSQPSIHPLPHVQSSYTKNFTLCNLRVFKSCYSKSYFTYNVKMRCNSPPSEEFTVTESKNALFVL